MRGVKDFGAKAEFIFQLTSERRHAAFGAVFVVARDEDNVWLLRRRRDQYRGAKAQEHQEGLFRHKTNRIQWRCGIWQAQSHRTAAVSKTSRSRSNACSAYELLR